MKLSQLRGGGYNRRNYFPPLKNSFQFLKNLKILFSITFILSFFFTSCNLLSDDDSGTLSINLPPIVSNSRSITGERIEFLKNATASYRVTVNDMTREGSEAVYEFTLPVGIVARITVECLNSSGQVIVRAYQEHSVTGGDNVVSIILKNDGDEIINDGVTYSYGDAAAGGAVTGFPSSVKLGVGEKFTVTGTPDTITWDHGTFNGWITNVALKGDDGTADVDAGGTVPPGTYIMPSQNVTLTATWQKNSYTITYNTNSPAGANVSSVANLPMTDALTHVTLATAPTVTNNPVTSGSGQKNYTFLHWRDASDGTTYSAGTQITLTKSMTLEAVWSDETVYTVTFVSPSKSVSVQYDQQIPSSPQTVEVGNSLSWTNPSALGWTFGGWEVSDAGDSSVTELPESATSYTPKGNTTLTAKLTAKSYTVNYDVRNGEGTAPSPAPKTIISWDSSGGNFARNDGAGFSRPGYTLTSWEFSDGTSAGTKGMTASGRVFMEKADGNNSVTVYAVWTEIPYRNLSAAEVGDVICANGKVLSASDITTELQGETVAIVYKIDANTKTAWAVGKVLSASNMRWADTGADGYNKNITGLQEENGYTDGRTGLDILRADINVADADDENLVTNYPAWDYAYNYGTNPGTNAGIPIEMQSGWYLPSKQELQEIYNNKGTIETSLSKTGATKKTFDSSNYWSSSQYADGVNTSSERACLLSFTSGTWVTNYSGLFYVCAVRQFTW